MSIGVISVRYARALYSLALDRGQEAVVYTEMSCMLQQFLLFPEMRHYLTNPVLKADKKVDLLLTAAGSSGICPTTKDFIEFVVKHEKQDVIQFMCVAYKDVYHKAKNILVTKFTSANEVDEKTLNKVKAKIENTFKGTVLMETKVDKSLIGGFILDVDNNRLDASVSGELYRMKAALKNAK